MWHGMVHMVQRKTKICVSPRPVIPGRTTQYSLPTKLDHIPLIFWNNFTPRVPLTP